MSHIRLKNDYWYVVFYDSRTKRQVMLSLTKIAGKPVTTRRQAEKVHQTWMRTKSRPVANPAALGSFFQRYREYCRDRKTEYTQQVDNHRMERFEAWAETRGIRRIDRISHQDLESFRGTLTCGPETKNKYIRLLRAAFNVAISWDMIDSNPAARIMPLPNYNPKPVRALSDEEVTIILESFPSPEREFCALALLAGFRRSDIVYLDWADIDLKAKTITLRPKKGYAPKSIRYQRSIKPLPIVKRLQDILSAMPQTGDRVFSDNRGMALYMKDTWTKRISAMMKAFDIKGAAIHSLRHTFITNLSRAGVGLMALRELARHSSLATTLRYTHLEIDDLQKEVDKLEG